MTSLGFPIDLDDSQLQPDDACGVVAAAVANRMQAPDWRHVKLDFAVDPSLATRARRILCIGHDAWLSERHVQRLYDILRRRRANLC